MPTPRSRWIAGSATFTTVLSSMIMNSPNETAASVNHLRLAGSWMSANTGVQYYQSRAGLPLGLPLGQGRKAARGTVAPMPEVVWEPTEEVLERANVVRF